MNITSSKRRRLNVPEETRSREESLKIQRRGAVEQVKREARMTSEERILELVKSERARFREQYERWKRYYMNVNARLTIGQNVLPCNRLVRPKTPTKVIPFKFHLE